MGQLLDPQIDIVFGLAILGIVGVLFLIALAFLLVSDLLRYGWRRLGDE